MHATNSGQAQVNSSTNTNFVADIGKGVALGLKALGPLKSNQITQGNSQKGDDKARYTDDNIAALMGFSHVQRGNQLQPIWASLNTSKGKNIHIYRRQIWARMKQWANDCRIPIDTSVYLKREMTKAIIELKFNPGEGVAHLSSASKGLSIKSCRGRTSVDTEQIRECEVALLATENTRQLDELLRLSKGITRAPVDNFWELKINIATFMSFMWVLFGSKCDYYKGL
jgi:hypothetical protein